jgi:hypothetical protein
MSHLLQTTQKVNQHLPVRRIVVVGVLFLVSDAQSSLICFLLSGPSCRGTLDKERLFKRSAFEPTDKELFGLSEEDTSSDIEMADGTADNKNDTKKRKGQGNAKSKTRGRKVKRAILDDDVIDVDASDNDEDEDYEEEDDDMADFIVDDDEDDEEYVVNKKAQKTAGLGRRKAQIILDSDDEVDETPEEKEAIFGRKKKVDRNLTPEQIKLLPKFLPSTKMMVR